MRAVLPHDLLTRARSSDDIIGHVLESLKPDTKNFLFADMPELNFATATTAVDDVRKETFQPIGKLNNGLWAFDRQAIAERMPEYQPPDPVLWTGSTGLFDRICRRMEDHLAAEISAEVFRRAFDWDLVVRPGVVDATDHHGPLPRYLPLRVAEGPEEAARGLLMRMVGPEAFRGYVRRGFVSYRGRSGDVYQVFPGMQMVNVWRGGQPLKKLCVVFQDKDIPPTDWVIMRLLMLEHDEQAFCALAHSFPFEPPRRLSREDQTVPSGRIARLAAQRMIRSA